MGKEMEERLFQSLEIDALLLTGTPNMRYAAGFTGEGYVYLSGGRRIVVTDARYTAAACEECADCEVVEWKKDGYYATLTALLQEDSVKRLGFEDSAMTVAFYNKINCLFAEKGLRDVIFVPVQDKVDFYRAVKTEEEQKRIRRAEAIGDTAFSQIVEQLRPGMTEKQVAALLEFYMKEAGADGLSFDTIAASGHHSAMPHAIPTDKKLEEGEFLTMDFGCRYQGYCSDMTRTVVIGKADEKQKEVYEIVLRAQQTALAGIRPGMTGKEADTLARDVIEEAGYGKYFTHSLGHSLGLEIHESPNFSSREERLIEPGMVITVEPGIYIEGFGGVRIEDVVIITEDGCENITHSPKQLIEIKKEKERCR